jgi:hypothetical protein
MPPELVLARAGGASDPALFRTPIGHMRADPMDRKRPLNRQERRARQRELAEQRAQELATTMMDEGVTTVDLHVGAVTVRLKIEEAQEIARELSGVVAALYAKIWEKGKAKAQ